MTLLGVVTGVGQPVMGRIFNFLEFYGGVFTLVSLTLTVITGLVATDRLLLLARHRMWVQSIHRTFGIIAVSCLVLHVATEVAGNRVSTFGAVVPFVAARYQIGLGTFAAYLMLTVMWSGIARARFASPEKAWRWRPLHATAYLSWPVALWHGLNTGRPAAVWVTASYLMLVLFTLVALGLRLSAEASHRQRLQALGRTTVAVAPTDRQNATWDASAVPQWDGPSAERPVYDRPPATYMPEPEYDRIGDNDPYWSQPPPAPEPAWGTAERRTVEVPREWTTAEQQVVRPAERPAWAEEPAWSTREQPVVARSTGRYPVEYPIDDTPTLVNLDSQRSMRRGSAAGRRGGRSRADDVPVGNSRVNDVADESYWAVLRGEAG